VIDIVQASGRALRTYEGKKFGYILLPIVIPEDMDFEEYAETTEFKTVARTIAALSIHDERIVEYFRLVQEGKRPSSKNIEFYGSEKLGQKIDLKEFSDAIEAKVWKRVGRANSRPFKKARAFVHRLNLKTAEDWRKFSRSGKKPADIPSSPNKVYKDQGWVSMGDWLGTGTVANRNKKFRPFKKARAFVHSLNLETQGDWRKFCRSGNRPADIPSNPDKEYKDKGWISWSDWLGEK